MIRQTHTFSVLNVPPEVYNDIRARLKGAGYEHAFLPDGDGQDEVIDMHGIALAPDAGEQQAPPHAIASIATMLGWVNVPPLATLERDINALKARVVAELVDLGEWVGRTFELGADRSQVADPKILALRDVVAQICQRISDRRAGTAVDLDVVTGGLLCGHPRAYGLAEDGTPGMICLRCRVDLLIDFIESSVRQCPRCDSCRSAAELFLETHRRQPTSRRYALLEAAAAAGYALSLYAASVHWDSSRNTKDWLVGLRDCIEQTQASAEAAVLPKPPATMRQERPAL